MQNPATTMPVKTPTPDRTVPALSLTADTSLEKNELFRTTQLVQKSYTSDKLRQITLLSTAHSKL